MQIFRFDQDIFWLGHSGILAGTQHPTSLHQIEMLENRRLVHMDHSEEDSLSREPPSFKSQLKSCEVLEGKAVHLEAKLMPTNDPNMKVEWLHNGAPVQTGLRNPRNLFSHNTFNIDVAFQAADFGFCTILVMSP